MGLEENKRDNEVTGQRPENQGKDQTMLQQELFAKLEQMQEQLDLLKSKREGGEPVSGSFNSDELAAALIKAQNWQKDGQYYADPKEVDQEDYDETGVVFSNYSQSYIIVDDVKKGRPVKTPYHNVIKFVPQGISISYAGKDQILNCFCTYRSHLKKEIEWLRDHSKYGIDFFENTNQAVHADRFHLQTASRIMQEIQALGINELTKKAAKYKIPKGSDVQSLRIMVAKEMAAERIKKYDQQQQERAKQSFVTPEITRPS